MALKAFKIHHSGSHDRSNQMVKIPDLVINFNVTKPSHVFIMGSVGYAHRKISLDVSSKSKSEIRDLKNRYWAKFNGICNWNCREVRTHRRKQ